MLGGPAPFTAAFTTAPPSRAAVTTAPPSTYGTRRNSAETAVGADPVSELMRDVVQLNVGGRRFSTTVGTLRRHPHSVLAQMFSEPVAVDRDDSGAYFIDRNGDCFEFVLDYLRDGYLHVPVHDAVRTMQLKRELAFYGLPVVHHFESYLKPPQLSSSSSCRYEHVHIIADASARQRIVEGGSEPMSSLPADLTQRPLVDIINFFGARGYVMVSEYNAKASATPYVSVWLAKQIPAS
eukprot:PhM_4_TR9422/c0_g1_i1/m.67379